MKAWIPGLVPTPKGNSPRIVRRGKWPKVLPSKRAVEAQKALTRALKLKAPPEPLRGPLRRDCVFYLPIPQSWPKWKQAAAMSGSWLPEGGGRQADTGNLTKLLDDALEGAGWLLNDGQIVGGETLKLYGEPPGYLVRLTPLAQGRRSQAPARALWWHDIKRAPQPTTTTEP